MEKTTYQENIVVLISAAAQIPASTEGYVRKIVTLTAPGLTVPVVANTLVSGVVR